MSITSDAHLILARMPRVTINRLPNDKHKIPGRAVLDAAPWEMRSAVDVVVGNKVVGLDALNYSENLDFDFYYEQWVQDPQLVVGASYPSTPWRMRNEVRIAIEREVNWARTKFAPRDGYSPKNNLAIWRSLDDTGKFRFNPNGEYEPLGPYDPEKHILVPGRWDHEHCDMCLVSVDNDSPWCYANDNGEWLCDECHQKYAIEGSLDFLIGYTDETHP